MAPIPATIGDFSVLPVRMPALPSLEMAEPATHYIYVRPNAPKIPTADDERSLFLANVPADSTEAHMRAIFAQLVGPGRFESIVFEDERRQAAAVSESAKTAILPGQAARLAALQSRKRKRESRSGAAADDDAENTAETAREQQARLPSTWPQRLRRSGSTAVVLLVDERSVSAVLKAVAKTHVRGGKVVEWASGATMPSCGPFWLAAHNRLVYPDRATIDSSVNAFFALYNEREAAAAETARRLRNEPDEDGFVTVTGGGNSGAGGVARRAEAEAARAKQLAKQEKKTAELTNFYRFQLREQKKEEQAELQRRFQDDRLRVAAMREKRGKFRPEA
ncbi:meiotic recombination protein dmc1 [Grosmannia clavigera kw1407]|uniref:Meiotic recombination protein dmc1 n=1 Tax=Grosmannia clavigera (strain kw1407 / UAMH 11150) TaxID=655863 RepID=F0XSS0_GROCL|nr:meiotic recombination protein dmc1 [Grosmannia clavigera kw1407]EFW99145.1 meiotic recombination protein dmc1 [Grosmannia clavigera kw1407]